MTALLLDPFSYIAGRAAFLGGSVLPSRESMQYRRELGIDLRDLEACAGCLSVQTIRYFHDRTFEPDPAGIKSVVIEALDSDAETGIDFVAWPLGRPDKFARLLGVAEGLGIGNVEDPATYFGGKPLLVHGTPEAWLKAGGQGVVILDHSSAPRWLSAALGAIAGEDVRHARELARLLHPFVEPGRFVAPIQEAA